MSVKRLPDGRWQARWRSADGKQHAKRFNTKREARDHEMSMRLISGRGDYEVTIYRKRSMSEMADAWLSASINLAPATLKTYRRDLDRYILKAFGPTPIEGMTPLMIQTWIASELSHLAPSSVHRHYRTLRTMFSWLIKMRYLDHNPCAAVNAPRVPKKAPAFLTVEQVEMVADEMPDRYRALILVAAYGGLRWGEVIGLRRCDVDGARLTVTGQLQNLDGRWVRVAPKTAAGRRLVILPASIADDLAAHMVQFTHDHPDALIFTNGQRNPIGPSFRHNVWQPALGRAGLITVTRRSGRVPSYGKGPTFHDLRHTAVALAIAAGAHPKAIQARLGHASIGVTMDTYGHLIDDGSGLAADLDRLRRPD